MICWVNGSFGAGKTTLTDELTARYPGRKASADDHTGESARPASSRSVLGLGPGAWAMAVIRVLTELRRISSGAWRSAASRDWHAWSGRPCWCQARAVSIQKLGVPFGGGELCPVDGAGAGEGGAGVAEGGVDADPVDLDRCRGERRLAGYGAVHPCGGGAGLGDEVEGLVALAVLGAGVGGCAEQ
jgi:hypothetical protein